MGFVMNVRVVSTFVALSVCVASLVTAREADPKPSSVTLTKRADSAYGTAAFSFRTASSDLAVHKNYVDLVFNGCGLLHVAPTSGSKNRICDLGKHTLDTSPDAAPADVKWLAECVTPVAGHVYLEDINDQGQTMQVKFRVDELKPDAVTITYLVVTPLGGEPMDPRRGRAGTMGQCGGKHGAE